MADTIISFDAIGTKWNIEIFGGVASETAVRLKEDILQTIGVFDTHYSRFRSDSLVTGMSRKAGRYTLPADAQPMLDLYRELYGITDGNMTPLIGQTLVQAGYDPDYSLKPGKLTTPPKWDDAIAYDFPHLDIKEPVLLDFGAAGKGYLADIVGRQLDGQGIPAYAVNAGGDIVYKTDGGKKLEVALEHPGDPAAAIGIARLHNQSICGSSGSRRSWGAFNHIISPRTLSSPGHLSAVWVAAGTALLADALTTALYFVGPAELQKRFNFEYAMVKADMSIAHSPAFPAEFFTADSRQGDT